MGVPMHMGKKRNRHKIGNQTIHSHLFKPMNFPPPKKKKLYTVLTLIKHLISWLYAYYIMFWFENEAGQNARQCNTCDVAVSFIVLDLSFSTCWSYSSCFSSNLGLPVVVLPSASHSSIRWHYRAGKMQTTKSRVGYSPSLTAVVLKTQTCPTLTILATRHVIM